MSWVEQKYMNLLGTQLDMFKQKGPELWNFRCPYCGDSEKNKRKARGYVFQKQSKYIFHCQNCKESHNIQSFFAYVNPDLYDQYTKESFASDPQKMKVSKPKAVRLVNDPLKDLLKVSVLPPSHSCKKYVVARQIPTTFHHKLFYSDQFMRWTNTMLPGKFSESALIYDGPRLVMPCLDKNNKMFGFQGRSLNPDDSVRYISIMLDEEKPRIFGMDTVDVNRRFFVFEGPIDSMFIENSVATMGSRIDTTLEKWDFPKENCVIVYDNQPRNLDVIKNMLHAVRRGYNICVWPNSPDGKDDVNDLILRKVSPTTYVKTELVLQAGSRIRDVIESRVFSSLAAELEISKWRRV